MIFSFRALVMDDDLDNIDWGLEDDAFNYDDIYEK